MASKALITPERYFATQFEREPELVRGELVERPLPTFPHGNIQLRMGSRLMALRRQSYPVFTGVEVRVRWLGIFTASPTYFDVGRSSPPIACPRPHPYWLSRSVLRTTAWMPCCKNSRISLGWGVQHIWLVEPELKRIHIYDHGSLTAVSRLELPQFGFTITAQELFS